MREVITVWAKSLSNSATAMACAACIATAATLPVMGTAAEQLAEKASVKLSALSDIDAFSAIPLYLQLLSPDINATYGLDSLSAIAAFFGTMEDAEGVFITGGGIDALLPNEDTGAPGYAALSALPVFFGSAGLSDYDALSAIPEYRTLLTGTNAERLEALGNLDSVSAIPVFVEVANADTLKDAAAALGGYDALSAADTFFGDGPEGQDGKPIGGVFTGGGIDALAPNADSGGGYAALSALPVFFGTNANAPFGKGVFVPGGGVGALSNYDALSAIPALLPSSSTMTTAATAAPEETSTPTTGSGPVRSLVNAVTSALPGGGAGAQSPQSLAPQAVSAVLPTPKADNSGPALNITRDSKKFTPESIGNSNSPILFGNGSGVDNGIRGWGSALKKLGIDGGDTSGTG
jgi:hypothetical protein